jgi:hypothetical protein
MTNKYQRAGVFAATGLVVGGMATYLTVNAAQEGRSGSDVFLPHANHNAYWIDVAGGIACGALAAGLSAFKDWWSAHRNILGRKSAPLLDAALSQSASSPPVRTKEQQLETILMSGAGAALPGERRTTTPSGDNYVYLSPPSAPVIK